MRCEEVRDSTWESEGSVAAEGVKQHLDGCEACRSYMAALSRVRRGLGLLAREEAPEAMLGFGARVLRRLREEGNGAAAAEPLESAGRRVILATLVLVFTLLLAMILPSSGPVRHEATLETYWSQTEAATPAATTVSYASDWSIVPPAPVLVMEADGPGNP